jgi:hypothetical protein
MSTATQSNWALQPPPPPAEQLRAYAQQLPDIYRDILIAFQTSGPPRTEGDPVAFGTVENHLINEGKQYADAELALAFDNLAKDGILSKRDFGIWYAPTRVGEALIEVLTGRPAKPVSVPALPAKTW